MADKKKSRKGGLGKLLFVCLILLVGVAVASVYMTRTPPILRTDRGLEAALTANRDAGGDLLIVKASSDWCGVCRAMNTVFRDDSVNRWIMDHGEAVLIDINKRAEDAKTLDVKGLPTLVVYRDGEEIGRHIGYHSPKAFVEWLETMTP